MSPAARSRFEVVGIGNAIVDVLSDVEDSFLLQHGVAKGIMHLIDLNRAAFLYGELGAKREVSGGSAANTVAGVAMLGGKAGFLGKVCTDALGDVFAADLSNLGVAFSTPRPPAGTEFETGRSMVLISPNGERTMNTYLGAAEFLTPEDIDADMVANTRWLFLEGYRLDGPDSVEAFNKAVALCHSGGGSVALTLSDPFCVDRNRIAFEQLIAAGVELLVSNRAELTAMYNTDDLNTALDLAVAEIPVVACTLSAEGAIIAEGGNRICIEAFPANVVDATGAGDLFAAGFLQGMVGGHDLGTAGRMGCAAASEVISHVGARPQQDLGAFLSQLGLPAG